MNLHIMQVPAAIRYFFFIANITFKRPVHEHTQFLLFP
jgi:hypothetical protein